MTAAMRMQPSPTHWTRFKGRSPNEILVDLGVFSAPVDIRQILARMGVIVHDTPDTAVAGAVKSDGDVAQIWVREQDVRYRQRFTLAHELGHLLLHDEPGMMFRDPDYRPGSDVKERQANNFAAELLMPEWMLSQVFPAYGRDVAGLARVFDVSPEAMRWRLKNLLGV